MDQQAPISARASASDPSIATQGPIHVFDVHLRFLTDSYIGFFQERKRIEEVYVDSLKKLHRKAKSTDAYLEEKGELSTTRSAWLEVRDNLEREAQARQAFCATLTTDVLNPLNNLKETQERTRKRIKEDLKDSTSAYNEYAEIILPKLKGRYVRKFIEVEDQKKASAGPSPLQQPLPQGTEQQSKNNGSSGGRPTVTSPQPLRALDRRPSGSSMPARNRSPSSSTAFSDLAHQGKRQLNQLMGLLDKSGPGGGGLGSSRENQALRAVRAKREADEADKEYRKGVHWLETLRLRRTKILESGYTSLEMFVNESATTLKKTLEKYIDNMIATSTTQTQLSKHAKNIVDKVSPEKDSTRLVASTRRSLASAIPDPILYEHGQVGFCNDLIFGFSLGDYATSKGLREGEIPKIVRICIAEIDKRGLESEGIYRVSGRHAIVQVMQHEIEKDEASFEFTPKDDVFAVSSLLKLYLRELPEPLFRFSLQDRLQHSECLADHQNQNFMLLRAKMRRLPPVHQATLKVLIEHLSRVVTRHEKNKMDAKNLAIVFGSMIFGEDELPKGGDLLSVQPTKDTLFEDLIINAHVLFDEHPGQYPHSPPLPPTPAGEAALDISYGSKSTRVATVLPKPLSPPPPSSPEDFTPMLPPRPGASIHPSSRIMPTSPTRSREVPSPTVISTLPSTSVPSSPSPLTDCETDDSLSYHDPTPLSHTESQSRREHSSSTSTTSATPVSPPSLRKTELPPTPKETPATSPLEPHASKDN